MVLFFVELVCGKDRPKEIGKPEFEGAYGATGGMMVWMKEPLFGTGKSVVMDSGFCALKGIEGMLAHWVYGTTVIKEKRYCPN